jgi:hypothetical protein
MQVQMMERTGKRRQTASRFVHRFLVPRPSIFSSTPDSFFPESHHGLAQRGSCLPPCQACPSSTRPSRHGAA